jgi:hypothetical protein
MTVPKLKTKPCANKECKNLFTQERPMQSTCSPKCAIGHAAAQRKKREEKAHRIAKTEFYAEDKSTLIAKAQALANKYARYRDMLLGRACITCGTRSAKFDGGHFLPTSTHKSIRFYTLQIHLQCYQCNQKNSGRPSEYRVAMIRLYGLEKVEWLEAQRSPRAKYTVEYLNRYIKVMGKRFKKLENRLKEMA